MQFRRQSRHSISLATVDDVTAVQQCAAAAYTPYIERIGKPPAPMVADFAAQVSEHKVWVLKAGAKTAAFVVCYIQGDVYFLENMAVFPEYHGMGLGRQLLLFVEGKAIQLNCSAVELYTNSKMFENLKLYPYFGFVETDRRHEAGFDRVYFRKELV